MRGGSHTGHQRFGLEMKTTRIFKKLWGATERLVINNPLSMCLAPEGKGPCVRSESGNVEHVRSFPPLTPALSPLRGEGEGVGADAGFLAFTLVELLLVIAIIALLAAMILPALARARMLSRRTECISNLSQWGQAMQLYLDDNENFFPAEDVVDGINPWFVATKREVWFNSLPPYLGVPGLSNYASVTADQGKFYEKSSFFHCPAAQFSAIALTYPNFSYGMNSKIITPGLLHVSADLIQQPAQTPFFLDCGVPGEQTIAGQKHYNGQPHCFANRFVVRHGGLGTLVMGDGNVATLPANKVVDTNPKSPDYGTSIWPPAAVIWSPDPSSNPNR